MVADEVQLSGGGVSGRIRNTPPPERDAYIRGFERGFEAGWRTFANLHATTEIDTRTFLDTPTPSGGGVR
jgi:hypothetical protein